MRERSSVVVYHRKDQVRQENGVEAAPARQRAVYVPATSGDGLSAIGVLTPLAPAGEHELDASVGENQFEALVRSKAVIVASTSQVGDVASRELKAARLFALWAITIDIMGTIVVAASSFAYGDIAISTRKFDPAALPDEYTPSMPIWSHAGEVQTSLEWDAAAAVGVPRFRIRPLASGSRGVPMGSFLWYIATTLCLLAAGVVLVRKSSSSALMTGWAGSLFAAHLLRMPALPSIYVALWRLAGDAAVVVATLHLRTLLIRSAFISVARSRELTSIVE